MICRAKAYNSIKWPPSLEVHRDGGSSTATKAIHYLAEGGEWAVGQDRISSTYAKPVLYVRLPQAFSCIYENQHL